MGVLVKRAMLISKMRKLDGYNTEMMRDTTLEVMHVQERKIKTEKY